VLVTLGCLAGNLLFFLKRRFKKDIFGLEHMELPLKGEKLDGVASEPKENAEEDTAQEDLEEPAEVHVPETMTVRQQILIYALLSVAIIQMILFVISFAILCE
jgi:hypothetical protein